MMKVSPYLVFITIILLITASYIFYKQMMAKGEVKIEDASAYLPEQHEPLPIVTEPPIHLQPIIEEGTENTTEAFTNPSVTLPTQANPFMNVLIPEIKYDPLRPEAAPIDEPQVKQELDDFFRVNFFNDPTDVFGKSQDQRQFITMPSTSVPNDRESYQNWLYNIVPLNCKAGGRAACLPGTDGGPITSLNQNF